MTVISLNSFKLNNQSETIGNSAVFARLNYQTGMFDGPHLYEPD